MSITQIVPIQVTLAPGATPLPQFGTSLILEELTTAQYANFIAQSGGLSTLKITPQAVPGILDDLGLTSVDKAYENVSQHFSWQRTPEFCYLGYRGVADQTHNQEVTILPDAGSNDRASVGVYALTGLQGGPYSYASPGMLQVFTLTVADAGGGDGAPGVYTVGDADGNNYTYSSGGVNVWTFTFAEVAAGLYRATVAGVDYDYTAAGSETLEEIRDGVFAQMTAVAHPSWTGNTPTSTTITVTGNNVGEALVVTTNNGPDTIDDMTLVETQAIVTETVGAIATGIGAAITGSATPPAKWDPLVAAAVVTITAKASFIGIDLGITSSGPSSGDLVQALVTDHRETVVTVRDALDTALNTPSHPRFVNGTSGTDTITIDGVSAGDAIIFESLAPNDNIVQVETQGVLTLRTSQSTRVTINENPADSMAYDGTYELTLFGITVSYVASSETTTSVRNAIQALVDANIPQVSSTAVGVNIFDMTGVTPGLPFSTVASSPASDAAMTAAVQTPGRSINDDIDRALTDANDWYIHVNTGSDIDIQVATDYYDTIANSYPRMHYWQSATDAIVNDPIATATDVGAITKNTLTFRSKGAWHPVPASATKAYEGAVAQWVAFTTKLPGQINPTNKRILGLTDRGVLTPTQEQNLVDKAVERFEWVPTLGPAGASISQRRFVPSGRMIDIQRALDQIKVVYQQLALDFITSTDVVPYTNAGLAQIHANVVLKGTDLLRQQGLVVGDYRYNNSENRLPKRSDASDADRQAGKAPLFSFTITIDLGITEIPQEIQVFQ